MGRCDETGPIYRPPATVLPSIRNKWDNYLFYQSGAGLWEVGLKKLLQLINLAKVYNEG
jgi:hypothetical protein